MARDYRPVDRDQVFLLPPVMSEWLAQDHLVWFVIAAVQRLDTRSFHGRAKLGGVGRRGYDPDMLLTLFVYAMAYGESSSRQIERLCETDVAFRIICASDVPDHTVLARFRKDHEKALSELLTQSLVLAAELGMVSLGVVAFDGTKIAANASREANRGEAHLRRLAEDFVSRVASTDDAEDALFGADRRGDELPPEVRDRTGRRERIGRALEQIAKRREAEERARREQDERARRYEQQVRQTDAPPPGKAPAGVDPVAAARARWERERDRAEARRAETAARRSAAEGEEGRRPRGRDPLPADETAPVRKARGVYDGALARRAAERAHAAAEPADGGPTSGDGFSANTTDPDSRLMKTRNGWVQGYNCQLAAGSDGLILAARATQDANDTGQFVPTVQDLTATLAHLAARTGRDDLVIGTLIGDAGYDTDANLAADGPDRLIPDSSRRTLEQRAATDHATGDPPAGASRREQMNHRLRTTEGHDLYKRRSWMIEAPNGWVKDRRGLRRFARRGRAAVQAELSLACAVTNIVKLANLGVTTSQLRTG